MNKSDLISAMAAEAQMSKADAKKALDAFITSVTNAMKAGDKVSLVGFGTFSVSERAERTGINPSTKATITIPAKKVAKFKAVSLRARNNLIMKIEDKLVASVISGLKALYGQEVPEKMVQMQKTKKEFEGHLTLVVFPFLKMSRK